MIGAKHHDANQSLAAYGTNDFKREFEEEVEEHPHSLPLHRVVFGGWPYLPDDEPEFGISVTAENWNDEDASIIVNFRVYFYKMGETSCPEQKSPEPTQGDFVASISKADGSTTIEPFEEDPW